jgi:hypothetical protein
MTNPSARTDVSTPAIRCLASGHGDLDRTSPIGIGGSSRRRQAAPGGTDELLAGPGRRFRILAGEKPPFSKERAEEAQTPHVPPVFRQLLVECGDITGAVLKKVASSRHSL